ncbi:MAG: SDR family NAD(P)-dependent oxidoreductase [Treponema sp.]|nr:SDR family NAD(P)-dependent oxidoreductase [Treponema sp.]
MCFDGKKAVIIGGTGGIGKFVTQELAKTKCNLVIQGRHFSKDMQCQNIKQIIQNFDFHQNDFFSNLCASNIYEEVKNADILIVCYGPFFQQKLHLTSAEQWNQYVSLNLTMPGVLISAALPKMIEKNFGRIIVFGGTGTENISGFLTNPVYAAAKTGLCSLVKSVAAKYTENGITCNAILPAQVQIESLSANEIDKYKMKMPQKKLIDGTVVAKTVIYLLENSEFSGSLITMDGGWQRNKKN